MADTWYIDWQKQKITRRATEYEELAQNIERALMIDRYYYPIYTWNTGSELQDLIGSKRLEYINGACKKNIEDALAYETRVLSVEEVNVVHEREHDYLITATINTTLGTMRRELRYYV